METAEISQGLEGDKLYQQRARAALPILVRQAKAGRKIYCADLADEIGIPNPRSFGWVSRLFHGSRNTTNGQNKGTEIYISIPSVTIFCTAVKY